MPDSISSQTNIRGKLAKLPLRCRWAACRDLFFFEHTCALCDFHGGQQEARRPQLSPGSPAHRALTPFSLIGIVSPEDGGPLQL